jgi:hypothetical protein
MKTQVIFLEARGRPGHNTDKHSTLERHSKKYIFIQVATKLVRVRLISCIPARKICHSKGRKSL